MSDQTRSENSSVLSVIRNTAGRFVAHHCLREARSLSYVTLLSLVPFLTVILIQLSSLPFYPALKERLLFDISSMLLPRTGSQLTGYLDSIPAGGKPVGVIGILFSLAVTFSLVLSFSRAVNTIWGTIRSDHILRSFLKFVALIILAPTVIIIAFTLQNYIFIQRALMWLFSLLQVGEAALLPSIRAGLTKGFSLVLNWGLFAFVYGLIPHGKVKPGPCIISGICAGTLWWVMRLGLNLYIEYIPQMNLLYGSLAFIPVFLIWVYGTWIIVLFGVELNYSLNSMNKSVTFLGKYPGRRVMGPQYISRSFEETVRYGYTLGESLTGGEVLLLNGVLGSGKTALAKGIAEAIGVSEVVTSPSFAIMNEYTGRLFLYHFDFYRIDDEAEMEDLLGDFAYREDAIVVIEWGERLTERLGSCMIVGITLQDSERLISVTRRRA